MSKDFKELELIQDIYQEYKNNPDRTPEYKQAILDKAEKNYHEDGQFSLWALVFSADKEMQKRFDLLETQMLAKKSLARYLRSKDILSMTLELAHVSCDRDEWNKEKAQVWKDVFCDIKDFDVKLEEKKNYWEQWRKKQLAKHIPKKAESVVDICILTAPLIVEKNNVIVSEEAPQNLVNLFISRFNEFSLQSYMDVEFIEKSTLELKSDIWHFTFEFSKLITDKQHLINELKGQLSDGWGETMDQYSELIGTDIYSVGFDYEQIKLNSQKKTHLRIKGIKN